MVHYDGGDIKPHILNHQESPITVCAHCRKPLTKAEVKATFEGTLTVWDERAKRQGITLDYCADGLKEIEEALTTSAREAVDRAEQLRKIDEQDRLKIAGKPT